MSPLRAGEAVFRARTKGIDSLVRDADLSARTLVSDTREAFRDSEGDFEAAYRRFAPVESGRLRDSTFGRTDTLAGGRVQLRVTIDGAVDPSTGYDYLEQSREGRGPIISRGQRMVLSKGRNKAGSPSYRYAGAGGLGFRRVEGFTPEGGDWVAAGERASRPIVDRLVRTVGQRITRHGIMRRGSR